MIVNNSIYRFDGKCFIPSTKLNVKVSENFYHKNVIHTYLKYEKTRGDFLREYQLSNKIFGRTYRKFATLAERKENHSIKIANAQRINNSNNVNYGKPRTIIDKQELLRLITKGYSLFMLMKHFTTSIFVIQSNIDYHGLAFNTTRDYPKSYSFSTISLINNVGKALDVPLSDMVINNDTEALALFIRDFDMLLFELKELNKKFKNRCRGVRTSMTISEYILEKLLIKYSIPYVNQFKVDKYFYDFRILDTKYLIEVDGHTHTYSYDADKVKTKIAEDSGYEVIRILNKELNIKDKRKCLENFQLKVLQKLGKK